MEKSRRIKKRRGPIDPKHRRSISIGLLRFWDKKGRKGKDDKEARRQRIKTAVIATTATAAGIGLVLTVNKVRKDLKVSQVDFDSIRIPPNGGIPDKITLAKYDSFPVGSLVKRNFKNHPLGARSHYAVYIGKNPKTGLHDIIDVGDDPLSNTNIIKKTTLEANAGPNNTEYELVKPNLTSRGTPAFTTEEIKKRAYSVLYSPYNYTGFQSNCETFARTIVEGTSKSTQAEKISKLTDFVSSVVLMTHGQKKLIRLSQKERSFNSRHRLTSLQIKGFLDDVKWADKISQSNQVLSKKELKKIAQIRERQKVISERQEYLKNLGYKFTRNFDNSLEFNSLKVENFGYKPMSQLCFSDSSTIETSKDFYSFFGIETPEIFYEKIEELKKQFSDTLIQNILEKELVTTYISICLLAARGLINNGKK